MPPSFTRITTEITARHDIAAVVAGSARQPRIAGLATRFPTAPPWYRPVLVAEDALLYRLRNHLRTQAHLHGDDRGIANFVTNSRLGIAAVERMVPGANASPYMVQHVGRYVWAMDVCRGLDVVDLGCGDGYGTAMLSWVGRSAVGIDISADAIESARNRYPGVEYRVGDLAEPAAIPAADVAVRFEVLEHIAAAEQLLAAAAKRVPRLLLSVPNPLVSGSHINPHHVNDWPLTRLKHSLRRAGSRSIRGHHQRLRDHRVSRGALPWHAFWLLDVRFA